ncbi:MAG: HD domain-containing protein [Candidatus Hodarchaeota archaeon]
MEEKYLKLKKIVEKELKEASPAHDINHVMRVYNLCLHLAKKESNIDLDVLKTAALLHDIARIKEGRDVDHAALGAEMSEKILKELGYREEKIEHVKHCIATHRFRGENKPETKEARILFDADKLDVLGAIGVARSFIIAGEVGEKIYSDMPVDQYIEENLVGGKPSGRIKDLSKHAPNLEFETKFKHIPNVLYTQKAKEIAKQRLEYMKQFFETLKREINGAKGGSSS